MNIFVTGGAGFMGSAFIRHTMETYPEDTVINGDLLTYAGNLENLASVSRKQRYTFLKMDIADRNAVESVCGRYQIDAIVNYAAETHVDRSIMDPEAFLRTQVLGTFELLSAARKFGIQKMIQISTDEVYGDVPDGARDEEAPFAPNSPYAAAKAGADHLCRSFIKTYQTPIVVTHSCNVYGEYQYPEKFIPLLITNLLEGKNVPVYGDGLQTREWIHVSDHCRAIDRILRSGGASDAYNIGTGEEMRNLDLARMILSATGYGDDKIEYVKDRPGHDRRYALNSEKIRRELGWEPLVPFAEGIKKTIAWYASHRDWWKKIKQGAFVTYYDRQYGKGRS